MRSRAVHFCLAAWVLVAAACVDAPSAPTNAVADNILVVSFDALSREAAQQGDAERSQEFIWAGLAIRGGIVPSRLEIRNNGTLEIYDAIVHAVTWSPSTTPQRVRTHRTLVAWRQSGAALQTLMVSSSADVAPVLSPLSQSAGTPLDAPFAGAHVLYAVRGSSSGTWVGVTGTVKIAPGGAGAPCVPTTGTAAPIGVSCTQVRYAVAFDVGIQGAFVDTRLPQTQSPVLRMTAVEQLVNGAKLTLSCANQTNASGC